MFGNTNTSTKFGFDMREREREWRRKKLRQKVRRPRHCSNVTQSRRRTFVIPDFYRAKNPTLRPTNPIRGWVIHPNLAWFQFVLRNSHQIFFFFRFRGRKLNNREKEYQTHREWNALWNGQSSYVTDNPLHCKWKWKWNEWPEKRHFKREIRDSLVVIVLGALHFNRTNGGECGRIIFIVQWQMQQ